MQGEFRGDFTRDSFNPTKHFSRVLAQQGRVQLDVDWNEQAAILLHYLQKLAVNLIGPHAGNGFEIDTVVEGNTVTGLTIGSGHYYVNGILCENEKQIEDDGTEILLSYYDQQDYPIKDELPKPPFLVYLDVWERHISYVEDDSIREVALNGFDTATRAKVIWQVKVTDRLEGITKAEDINTPAPNETETRWEKLVKQWQPVNRGMLKAKGKQKASDDTSPCITPPEARYQGAENHLYRVEIHRGGTADGTAKDGATFKWSRENSSIAVPVLDRGDKTLTVDSSGRDTILGFSKDQWVELTDDTHELSGIPGTLLQIVKVEGQVITIDVGKAKESLDLAQFPLHPKLRRWDYQGKDPKNGNLQLSTADNALEIKEGTWLPLEDGIEIQFKPGANYRTGDYWLIPARTATGDILWPTDPNCQNPSPAALPPHGVEHHYAPLAIILSADNSEDSIGNCRKTIKLAVGE